MSSEKICLIPSSPAPVPIPTDPMGPPEVSVAIAAFQSVISAGVEAAKNHDDAVTQRALISAQKQFQIAQLDYQRAIETKNLEDIHQRRMQLIKGISDLLVTNASNLTPEILSASQILLQALREER